MLFVREDAPCAVVVLAQPVGRTGDKESYLWLQAVDVYFNFERRVLSLPNRADAWQSENVGDVFVVDLNCLFEVLFHVIENL